jgi:hypothetical protein
VAVSHSPCAGEGRPCADRSRYLPIAGSWRFLNTVVLPSNLVLTLGKRVTQADPRESGETPHADARQVLERRTYARWRELEARPWISFHRGPRGVEYGRACAATATRASGSIPSGGSSRGRHSALQSTDQRLWPLTVYPLKPRACGRFNARPSLRRTPSSIGFTSRCAGSTSINWRPARCIWAERRRPAASCPAGPPTSCMLSRGPGRCPARWANLRYYHPDRF